MFANFEWFDQGTGQIAGQTVLKWVISTRWFQQQVHDLKFEYEIK